MIEPGNDRWPTQLTLGACWHLCYNLRSRRICDTEGILCDVKVESLLGSLSLQPW